jgi:hypothetical protein
VTAHGYGISGLYFGFGPVAGHLPDCPRAGTDVWEVTRHQDRNFDGEVRRTTFRLACHDCGVVHFQDLDGPDLSFETTHGTEAGYGSKPEKVLGLWLWPGPRIWHGDSRGPMAYYVTRGKARPRAASDVAGVVGWRTGPRGGVKWAAGLAPTKHGTVQTPSGQDFGSRRAAVAWIAAQLAEPQGGDGPGAGFPVYPAGQIGAEVAEDVHRLAGGAR